ncbi:MAG: PaaI family thioesterase [Deltaproteobacteria bacterium]
MYKQPSSRTCFICGRENEVGLKMDFYNDNEAKQVRSQIIIPEHFNGYPGVAHGGIIGAILDETSGRAVMLDGNKDDLFVTTKLEVKYRKPTPTEEPLTVIGWIIRRDRTRAKVAAELRRADGTVTAQCHATVIKPPAAYLELCNWAEEDKYWRVYED